MNKKDCLKIKKLTATPQMIQKVNEDQGIWKRNSYSKKQQRVHEIYTYYRAVIQDGILKVAVFTRKDISEGLKRATYEIYISKDEDKWMTYEPCSGKWFTAKIDNLQYDYGSGYWESSRKTYSSDETKKTCE